MGCCFKTTSAIAAEKAATAEEAAEAKKDLADPPIPVFFLLRNAAQGSEASKQHQLQVRRKDPTGEWKWRLLQLCVDAKQADPRYLPEELHLEFCSAAIAHTQCLDEHGVEPDALVDVQLADDVFTDRLNNVLEIVAVRPRKNISCKVWAGEATGGGCCGGGKDDSERAKLDFTLDKRLNPKTKRREYYFGKSADSWESDSLPVKELTFKLREDGYSFTVTHNAKPKWALEPKTIQAQGPWYLGARRRAFASAGFDPSNATEWVQYLNDSKAFVMIPILE